MKATAKVEQLPKVFTPVTITLTANTIEQARVLHFMFNCGYFHQDFLGVDSNTAAEIIEVLESANENTYERKAHYENAYKLKELMSKFA